MSRTICKSGEDGSKPASSSSIFCWGEGGCVVQVAKKGGQMLKAPLLISRTYNAIIGLKI